MRQAPTSLRKTPACRAAVKVRMRAAGPAECACAKLTRRKFKKPLYLKRSAASLPCLWDSVR